MSVEGDLVIEKGNVRMDMFSALNLEKIQVIGFLANRMYTYYLSGKKWILEN